MNRKDYLSEFGAEVFPHVGHMSEIEQQLAMGAGAGLGSYLAEFGAEVFTPRRALVLDGSSWQAGLGVIEPRREDWGILPSGTADMGAHYGGDITGAKGARVKRARAVGQGLDPAVSRQSALTAWAMADKEAARALELAPMGIDVATIPSDVWAELLELELTVQDLRAKRACIVDLVMAESNEGQRLLTLAGGAGYGNGRVMVGMQSSGMAARAARYLVNGGKGKFKGRGVEPSMTSLNDAAATAVEAMVARWARCRGRGCQWDKPTIGYLARFGWSAAFMSFQRDQAQGKTGANAGASMTTGSVSVSIDDCDTSGAVDRESLMQWANGHSASLGAWQGPVLPRGELQSDRDRAARRHVLEWFASVLDIHATGRTGFAERARFSLSVAWSMVGTLYKLRAVRVSPMASKR